MHTRMETVIKKLGLTIVIKHFAQGLHVYPTYWVQANMEWTNLQILFKYFKLCNMKSMQIYTVNKLASEDSSSDRSKGSVWFNIILILYKLLMMRCSKLCMSYESCFKFKCIAPTVYTEYVIVKSIKENVRTLKFVWAPWARDKVENNNFAVNSFAWYNIIFSIQILCKWNSGSFKICWWLFVLLKLILVTLRYAM